MKKKLTKMKNKPRLYILMRNDLQSMNPGRAMAQASHASNAFIHKYGKRADVKKWQKETSQGFGTAIVLAASIGDIHDLISRLPHSIPACMVVDPEYGVKTTREILSMINYKKIMLEKTVFNEDGSVVIFRSETTCAYAFGTREKLAPFLGHLSLHP